MSRRHGLLTAGQRESLERDGYLLVPSLLDETVLAPMRARLDELVHQTLVAWDADPAQDVEERGVVHANLGLPDPDFAPCREHPLLAEAAVAVLGPDWHLGGLELRAPLPGCGHQGLHPDYFPGHRTRGPWRSLSAMWCISAFTPDNGPLRVIPGSHRVDRNPADALPLGCEMGPHPVAGWCQARHAPGGPPPWLSPALTPGQRRDGRRLSMQLQPELAKTWPTGETIEVLPNLDTFPNGSFGPRGSACREQRAGSPRSIILDQVPRATRGRQA